MTLADCRTLVRLYSGLSTCTISTTDLDVYIARAERRTVLDYSELNPALAVIGAPFTWPANSGSLPLNNTTLPALGTNRLVLKIVCLGERSLDGKSWYWWTPGEPQELAGDANPKDRRDETATVRRWLWTGKDLILYPASTDAISGFIQFTRIPKLAATATDVLLQDLTATAQEYDEMVALRATEMVIKDRGMDGTWIAAQIEAYQGRVDRQLKTVQLQETPVMPGPRYETRAGF